MRTILVATDLSERGEKAVARAALLARQAGAALHIVSVVGEAGDAAETFTRSEEVEAELERIAAGLEGIETRTSAGEGAPAEVIPRAASDAGADLVVLGTHRNRGLAEVLRVPTLVRIVRALDMPVLIAAGPPDAEYGRVVVGWDFSPASPAALELAGAIAPQAGITLVHATHEPYSAMGYGVDYVTIPEERRSRMSGEILEAVPGALRDRVGEPVLRMGGPAIALLGAAREAGADLLVVGRHTRGGMVRMLVGETSTDLMLSAGCDLLVAPPPG